MSIQCAQHCVARRDNEIGREQAAFHFTLVTFPLRRWRVAVHSLPPREYARMSDDECWRLPRQLGVCVTVEMNQIGLKTALEMQQPTACTFDVGPAARHPFQFVLAFEQAEISDAESLFALRQARPWAHRRE